MKKKSTYTSKVPDEKGYVSYTEEEHAVWDTLFKRQYEQIQSRACNEYLSGLHTLKLIQTQIPQIPDVNRILKKATGWQIAPVPALIDFQKFFSLLANQYFPAATFIRTREELEYLKEPDIFHELFGHCPLLTNPTYARFMQEYGALAQKANHADQVMLARLYWFTVEFGLIQSRDALKIYGGGILSSMGETLYALESSKPQRKRLDIIDMLRTPYRIDIFQPIYFFIDSFDSLYQLCTPTLYEHIQHARTLGMHAPLYEKEPKKEQASDAATMYYWRY